MVESKHAGSGSMGELSVVGVAFIRVVIDVYCTVLYCTVGLELYADGCDGSLTSDQKSRAVQH